MTTARPTELTRAAAITAGLGFLMATATFMAGEAQVTAALETHADRGPLQLGATLQVIDGLAIVLVAVALGGLLRRVSPLAAAGYLGLRLIELVVIAVYAAAAWRVASGGLTPPEAADVRQTLLLWIYLLNGLAGLLLSAGLLRTSLPRWLGWLGVLGYATILIGSVLGLMGLLDPNSGPGMATLAPGALFELAFPIYLLFLGALGRPVMASRPLAA